MKKTKILDIHLDGVHLECYKVEDSWNPFRVYRKVCNHTRQIAKYGDFFSVLCFLKDFYRAGVDTMTLADTISWAKETRSI